MTMLSIRDLVVSYPGHPPVTAVNGLDLEIGRGEVVGLVGESGSGKSTIARAVTGVAPVQSGQVILESTDVTNPQGRTVRELRKRVQLVFQDPHSSLNPRMSVGQAVEEAVVVSGQGERRDSARTRGRVEELFGLVHLPANAIGRYPHQFSGGQLQRIAIARALATEPEVLLLDEVSASLDVSVQATILNLLRDLRSELGLTFLYISHDLSIVRYLCQRVYVMEKGRIVESGLVEEVFGSPRNSYTKRLMSAVPTLGGARWRTRSHLKVGTAPSIYRKEDTKHD